MSSFVFASYNGDGAGKVLIGLLSEGEGVELTPELLEKLGGAVSEVVSETDRVVGFTIEDKEEEEDEEPSDAKRRPLAG